MMTDIHALTKLAGSNDFTDVTGSDPWQPTPTDISPEYRRILEDLAAQATGVAHEYILTTRYDAQGVGDLLRSWGLPLPVVLAGYLMEYDSDLIQHSGLLEADDILRHLQEAARYARDIEDERLHILLSPPYRDLDALLLAVATYYQALKRLQVQSSGRPSAREMLIQIESIGRTLLHITKRLGMWYFKRQIEDITGQLCEPANFGEDQREHLEILQKDKDALEHIRQFLGQRYRQITQQPVTIAYNICSVAGLKRRSQDAHTTVTSEKARLSGFDLVTFDVIVPMVKDCYMAFGILSQIGIIQDQVTDFIANPKPNGNSYIAFGLALTAHHGLERSITCQFQISTRVMQAVTNYGCLYPDYRPYMQQGQYPGESPSKLEEQFWNHNVGNIFRALQTDIASNILTAEKPIIVYDRSRVPIALPINATTLDFAYALGRDIGNIAVGAIVNNRQAPLYRQLEAGDMIEIRTARQIQANEAWLDYAVTPGAKQDIRAAQISAKAVRGGYALLLAILRRYHFTLTLRELEEELRLLFRRHKDLGGTQQEFLECIAGYERGHDVLNWAAQEIIKQIDEHTQRVVQGYDRSLWMPVVDACLPKKLVYYRQRICGQCRPSYPRDVKIIGRLRKQSGELIVHKASCAHLIDRQPGKRSILVPMAWQSRPPAFRVAFRVMVQDRRGLILELARHLRHHSCELIAITAEAANPRTGIGHIYFTIETNSEHEVLDIWEDVYKIENIVEVIIDSERTLATVCEQLNTLYQSREKLASKTIIEFTWEAALNSLPNRRSVLINPFNISSPPPPKMFFGRSEEIKTMWRELCENDRGRALVMYGPRRSGKSSICHNFVGSQLHSPNWGIVFSLQNAIRDNEEAILRHLAVRMGEAFHEQLHQDAPAWEDFQDDDPELRFRRLLQACFERAPNARLVLALDEFGGAIESHNEGYLEFRFFTLWKELMAELTQLSLVIALPTSAHYRLCSERFAPAFSFAYELQVPFLDNESAKRLLADPLNEQSIAIHPNTVALAVALTGGNPYYLALIGKELIDQLNRNTRMQVVSDTILKTVIDHYLASGAVQNFEFLGSELQNEAEFVILETMIDCMSRSNQEEMQLTKIASQAQMRVPIVRRHLDRLRSGLILEESGPASNPFYSFKIELVRRWLNRNRWFFNNQHQK